MINPNSHKTSFDIRLPPDPKSKSNKFITKGYSMSLCFLNITHKVVHSFLNISTTVVAIMSTLYI